MKKKLVLTIATGIFSGYLRPFPGTWGTMPAWLIAYFLFQGNQILIAAATAVCFFISVWASGEAEKFMGHDSRKIVIDEWAGMFVTLLMLPYSITGYLLAFGAFRFFDVVKIPPAAQFERLPRGWGVTMDDIAAGIYANIATQLLIFGIGKLG